MNHTQMEYLNQMVRKNNNIGRKANLTLANYEECICAIMLPFFFIAIMHEADLQNSSNLPNNLITLVYKI